ncbi:hypothetical protein EM6_2373 [Asticcacaulis excentricus]|uniref:Uncharacterized protein n=1 Tax=Asticcacaulis excentricus TaxID=78587 RepID=A0A3G9G733_9CAUL|nr:hypothetical protein EM6_2373 [Asticcacaulis excentricus]
MRRPDTEAGGQPRHRYPAPAFSPVGLAGVAGQSERCKRGENADECRQDDQRPVVLIP